jgi:hypothetical protein
MKSDQVVCHRTPVLEKMLLEIADTIGINSLLQLLVLGLGLLQDGHVGSACFQMSKKS